MKSLQRRFNAYLRKTTPAQARIKLWAHAATLLTAALIVPSLCAIYFRDAGLRENEPYWVWASITVWKIHTGVVAVTLVLWIFERPRVVKYLPVEPTDDEDLSSVGSEKGEGADPPPAPGSSIFDLVGGAIAAREIRLYFFLALALGCFWLAVLAGGVAVDGLIAGEIEHMSLRNSGLYVKRDVAPGAFWFSVTMYFALAGAVLYGAWDTFRRRIRPLMKK